MKQNLCGQSFILMTNITKTWLRSILRSGLQKPDGHLPAVFFRTTELIYKIAKDEFMFLTTGPQMIKLICKDSTRHLAIQTNQQITMKLSCELTTGEHVICTGLDLNVDGDIKNGNGSRIFQTYYLTWKSTC